MRNPAKSPISGLANALQVKAVSTQSAEAIQKAETRRFQYTVDLLTPWATR